MPVRAQFEASGQLDVAAHGGVISGRRGEPEHRSARVELDDLRTRDAADPLRGLAVERLGVSLRPQGQLDALGHGPIIGALYLPVVRCMAARLCPARPGPGPLPLRAAAWTACGVRRTRSSSARSS